jgi:hypothetical protein
MTPAEENRLDVGDLIVWLEANTRHGFRAWLEGMKRLHPKLSTPEILGSIVHDMSRDPNTVRGIREAAARIEARVH